MAWWQIVLVIYGASGVISYILMQIYRVRRVRERRRALGPPLTYAERMEKLTGQLMEASQAVDKTLQEMAEASVTQERALREQAERVQGLTAEQATLEEQIRALQDVPREVADYFAELLRRQEEARENRSQWRDYQLVAASATLSGAITVIIMLVFA